MRAIYILLTMLTAGYTTSAQSFDFELLFMPGELIAGHQELEAKCENCHVRLRDTTQEKLCRDCHEQIDEDISNNKGLHGRDKNALKLDCKSCHRDHRGREAKAVSLDRDKFDHGLSDFRLIGKHKLSECTACHLAGEKYREAKQTCNDCHADDDAHKAKLGKKCENCHTPNGWSKSEFNHDNTGFKLAFSHQRVSCNACHVDAKYKKTSKQCVSCHAIKDVHANRFGDQCQHCHQPKKWQQTIFDHNRDSKFSLVGKHREQTCNACHALDYAASRKSQQARDCNSCHRVDDVHNGSNGKKCQDCHTAKGWNLSSFDHTAATDFPLKGGHEKLLCAACHVAGAESKKIDTACYSCHKQDDAHKRKQGSRCEQCHNEISWHHQVRFDHDISSFPLIGQHAALGCEACHLSSVFGGTASQCVDCHRNDDVHKQKFGEDCAACHNPNAWLIWKFDHDQTPFKLRNAHAGLHCYSCHTRPLKQSRDNSWRCIDCHRQDDIHDGNFGGACDKCHNDSSFGKVKIESMKSFE